MKSNIVPSTVPISDPFTDMGMNKFDDVYVWMCWIGHVTLAAITGTIILVPYFYVMSQQIR